MISNTTFFLENPLLFYFNVPDVQISVYLYCVANILLNLDSVISLHIIFQPSVKCNFAQLMRADKELGSESGVALYMNTMGASHDGSSLCRE
jgi:hypothetical protein